jgi:hypothetical protein
MKHRMLGAALVVAALATVSLVPPATAVGTGRPLATSLTGADEVPGPGDPDGTGSFVARVNPGTGQLCYVVTVAGVDDVVAAHVHRAPVGVAGPVVVPLEAPTDGSSEACATIDRGLAVELAAHPAEFYVNVHSVTHPAGAVRGQLG